MFHGSFVALITPMTPNGEIDEESLRHLIEFHIAAGTDAIVAVGTTGEAATLTKAEQIRVIRIVTEQVKSRIPVIAGSGSNCTAKTIALTQAAMEAGADACLIVTPYYNKPTQEGLFLHYQAVADKAALPIILYNVPGRTGVDLLPETVGRLAKISNIVGIKEATGKVTRADEIKALCEERMDIYSGDDETALDLMEHGAKGVISVTANIVPDIMHNMCRAALNGEWDKARQLNEQIKPLHKALFLEANPIPAKWALYKMGYVQSGIRLPLTPLAEKYHARLLDAMTQAGART